MSSPRPTLREILTEAADTQHVAVLTWREARELLDALTQRDALAAAVDRVCRRHPRGDEEDGLLAPGLWCPTCGHERSDGGYGGCPDRNALRGEGE